MRTKLGTMSNLLSNAQPEARNTTRLVLDMAVIVQMLKPAAAKNFDNYAQDVSIPNLSTKLQIVSRLDLVWDRYIAVSLESSETVKKRVDIKETELFMFPSSSGLTRLASSWLSLMES